MKLRTRLGLGFGMVLLVLLAIAALGSVQMKGINDDAQYLSDSGSRGMKAISDIRLRVDDLRRQTAVHIMLESESEMADIDQRIERSKTLFGSALASYGERAPTDISSRQRIQAVSNAVNDYLELWKHIRELSMKKANRPELSKEAQEAYLHQGRDAYDKATAAIDELWSHEDSVQKAYARAAAQTYQRGLTAFSAAVLITLILTAVFASLVIRSVVGQVGGELDYAADVVSRIASGDLTVEIEASGGSKTSLLFAIAQMKERLTAAVQQIHSGAGWVADSSSTVASSSAGLSERSEQQARSLQETAASVEQLASAVASNAQNVEHAVALAAETNTIATTGGEMMNSIVETMRDMSESSSRISEIIGLIDTIAFQINILSLNAAVEAARAGAHGRGFAVVASEVRALARSSAEASKEIRDLINQSVSKVDAGAIQVNRAGETIRQVVSKVSAVAALIRQIGVSTSEQAIGIDQVAGAMADLDEMTVRNSVLADESVAIAEALKDQAGALAASVGYFRSADSVMPKAQVGPQGSGNQPESARPSRPQAHAGRRSNSPAKMAEARLASSRWEAMA